MSWNPSKNEATQAQTALLRAQALGIMNKAQTTHNGSVASRPPGPSANPFTRQSAIMARLLNEYSKLQELSTKTPDQVKRLQDLEVALQYEAPFLMNLIEEDQKKRNAAAGSRNNATGVQGYGSMVRGYPFTDPFAPREPNSNMEGGRRRQQTTRRRKHTRKSTRKNRKSV